MSEKHDVMAADYWLNYVHPDKLAQDEYKEHFEKFSLDANRFLLKEITKANKSSLHKYDKMLETIKEVISEYEEKENGI